MYFTALVSQYLRSLYQKSKNSIKGLKIVVIVVVEVVGMQLESSSSEWGQLEVTRRAVLKVVNIWPKNRLSIGYSDLRAPAYEFRVVEAQLHAV